MVPPFLGNSRSVLDEHCPHRHRHRQLTIRVPPASTSMPPQPLEEYLLGRICVLPKELTAARAILEEEHEQYWSQVPYDNNSYVLGTFLFTMW